MWQQLKEFLGSWKGKVVLAGVVVTGMGVWVWVRRKRRKEVRRDERKSEIGVDYVPIEILPKESLLSVFHIISERYSQALTALRTSSRATRRHLDPSSTQYREVVIDFTSHSKQLLSDTSGEVLSEHSIDETIVDQTLLFYAKDKEVQEAMKQMGEAISHVSLPESLTVDMLREVLTLYQDLAQDDDNIDEYLIETAHVEDQIHKLYGYESEEISLACEQYREEVQDLMDMLGSQTRFIMQQTAEDSFEDSTTRPDN